MKEIAKSKTEELISNLNIIAKNQPPWTLLQIVDAINHLEQLEKLRGFAQKVMENWPESGIEGDDLQELAIEYSLLKLKDPAPIEPCGDGCYCADYYCNDEWPDGVECYQQTELLKGEK